ncbi:MAG: DUF3558 family protein [Acidimicrobiia bacterium]|nr:DUF3558 family protein [Acidimicrobiia bacterium]
MNTDRFPVTTAGRWPSAWRLALTAVVVMSVAAGCGGGDEGGDAVVDPTSDAPDATDAAGATEAPDATDVPGDTEAPAPADPGDGSLDPCSLVTSDEAAAVLGDEPAEPTNVDAGGVGACTYRLADGSAAVQINVERGDADTFLSQISEGRGEELDGVGDAAVANETLGQVTVVKGDVRFAVFVSLADGEKTDLDTLFVLATTAVGRL